MDIEETYKHFEDCCIAWGYCQDAGHAALIDPIHADMMKLVDVLREQDKDANRRLEALMHLHLNPWVQYCCAAALLNDRPEASTSMLVKLTTQDGLWALMSQATLGSFQRGRRLS